MKPAFSMLTGLILITCCITRHCTAESPATDSIKIVKLTPLPVLADNSGETQRLVNVDVEVTGQSAEYEFVLGQTPPIKQTLNPGPHTVECWAQTAENPLAAQLLIRKNNNLVAKADLELKPVRPWTVYLLNHSHNDIGYTDLQPRCEELQWKNIERALAECQRTENYPQDATFKWNVEVLWAVKSYLAKASPGKKQAFIDAVKKGWIGLDALYANMLTGLCRPEELLGMLDYCQTLRQNYGFNIDSAMITDVPGLTWGIVPTLAQNGVRYLSVGPNETTRIGSIRKAWDNKPFYWVSPAGNSKILYWQTANGYSREFKNDIAFWNFIGNLEQKYGQSPYDMIYIRHCTGDNDDLDLTISDRVKNWNSRYRYPHFVIATTSQMMHDFENRYGSQLPAFAGDLTPYWEDGAASSAHESAINRATADRLTQAQTLWAMFNPDLKSFPTAEFAAAWQNVLLYSEHTWGARSYINKRSFLPGSEQYKAQWAIKQAFALDAEKQSRALLDESLAPARKSVSANDPASSVAAVDVINTLSWPRTDLVVLPLDLNLPGSTVKTADGQIVPSQRLSTGELAFLAEDVPPLASKRFTLHAPNRHNAKGRVLASENKIVSDKIEITIDKNTGAIESVFSKTLNASLVNHDKNLGWNDYLYVPSENPADAQPASAAKIKILDVGPLVAAIQITADAPGCISLTRTIRIIDGLDRIEFENLVDKEEIPLPDLLKKPSRKEAVYFAFPFNVPDPVARMETPWAVVRLEADQLPGACRDWYTVQRWIDVSNQNYGLTLATPDTPMAQFGKIADQKMQTQHINPTGDVFSYVMNNYWPTNYQHAQGGKTLFRYAVLPHRRFDSAAAARFGAEQTTPLIAVPVAPDAPTPQPILTVEPDNVLVSTVKPAPDNNTDLLVRLYNASAMPQTAKLTFPAGRYQKVMIESVDSKTTSQTPLAEPTLNLLPYEFATLRLKP